MRNIDVCKQSLASHLSLIYHLLDTFMPEQKMVAILKWHFQIHFFSDMMMSSNGNILGIHRLPVNSPHKGQWHRTLMFSLICALDKWLSKPTWGWWFEMPSCSLWCHCNKKKSRLIEIALKFLPGDKQLSEPMLTKICVAMQHHWATMSYRAISESLIFCIVFNITVNSLI